MRLRPGSRGRACDEPEPSVSTAAGIGVALAGAVFLGAGLWGRREARLTLGRERVRYPGEASPAPVMSPRRARSLAEFIRQTRVDATGGRTYAEIEPYLDASGSPPGTLRRPRRTRELGSCFPIQRLRSGSSRRRFNLR
jgi:hypothetical protein